MSFLFFIKPSTMYVDCFTTNVTAYKLAKIEPAIKFFPEWWKELPASYGDHPYIRTSTLKTCSGFLDLYKFSFMLPMWCDLAVDIGPIGSDYYKYQYSDNKSSAVEHPPLQKGKFCDTKNYQHLKLNSPWFIVSKKNTNWLFTDAVWNEINFLPYRVLNGVTNFKFNNSTNINMIFPRSEIKKEFLISYKTPLLQLIPMTEKKVKLNYHLIDLETLEKTIVNTNLRIKFLRRNATYKAEISKCPAIHD